ncbi:MAG: RluA family pseudouridine synthase [Eubacteriaceae bacterium]|nr:RluA family pseudouridine synthase [Eubacteriaceae bacterium]
MNNDNKEITFLAEDIDAGKRIDVYLTEKADKYSRSFIKKAIDDGSVFIAGKTVKASYKVNVGDSIILNIKEPKELLTIAQNIKLDIVYEDDDVILINKPQDMVVHPAAGNYENTLVNALLYHCKGTLSGIGGVIRPGIIHRIDKDTSGIIIAAKNDDAHNNLAQQFKVHSISRSYYAILHGVIGEEKVLIKAPIGRDTVDRKKMAVTDKNSKYAETLLTVIERFKEYTLVDAALKTGRTHQIRVHAQYISHPIAGDKVYGYKKKNPELTGQLLHAYKLGFVHPRTGEYMEFTTPVPQRFKEFMSNIE